MIETIPLVAKRTVYDKIIFGEGLNTDRNFL
jgi:hypothetical protein